MSFSKRAVHTLEGNETAIGVTDCHAYVDGQVMCFPIDPQIAGLPAASIVKARDSKPVGSVFDLTLVLADVAEKALAQVKQGAVELLTPRMEQAAAEALAAKLAGGHWTHDYAL